MRALLLTLLVGCYSPTIQAGSACDDVCPGDLVCIEHRCEPPGFMPDATGGGPIDAAIDAFLIDGPPGDVDGDGHLDNADNCPSKANADQHDEDGDAIGDVCDPCPHISGNAADGDGDGVGDVCDPQPLTPRQKIVFFDPFTSTRPEWEGAVNVLHQADSMEMVGNTTADGYIRLNVPTGELRIEMGGSIIALDGANLPRQITSSLGYTGAGGNSYHYIELYDSNNTQTHINIEKTDGTNYNNVATQVVNTALPTGAFSMREDESVTTQTMALTAKIGGVTYSALSGSTSTVAPSLVTSTRMSFHVNHADVRVDYWIVIETTP